MRTRCFELLIEFAKAHPAGFTSADVKRELGWDANKTSTQLARQLNKGTIISFDDRKAGGSPNCLKVYYPAGTPRPQEKAETLKAETLKVETAEPFNAYEALKASLGIAPAVVVENHVDHFTRRGDVPLPRPQFTTLNPQLA